MAVVLKGERSLESRLKKKTQAKVKLENELKGEKIKLWSLRKAHLKYILTCIISFKLKNLQSAKVNERKEYNKIKKHKEKIRSTSRQIEKLNEEINALTKGFQGEEYITQVLKTQLSDDFYILNGKKIEAQIKNQKEKAELDHLVIGPKGIICLEVKNISGRFYYESESEGWLKAPFSNPRALKTPMTSPLKQITRASKIFQKYLWEKSLSENILSTRIDLSRVNIYNLVVFTNDKCIFHGMNHRWEMPAPLLLKDELIPFIKSLPLNEELKDQKTIEEVSILILMK